MWDDDTYHHGPRSDVAERLVRVFWFVDIIYYDDDNNNNTVASYFRRIIFNNIFASYENYKRLIHVIG